jgi:hypothetical protein
LDTLFFGFFFFRNTSPTGLGGWAVMVVVVRKNSAFGSAPTGGPWHSFIDPLFTRRGMGKLTSPLIRFVGLRL